MTEREKQNEEMKRDLRQFAIGFHGMIERLCKFIDDYEVLLKYHEDTEQAFAGQIDGERVIG